MRNSVDECRKIWYSLYILKKNINYKRKTKYKRRKSKILGLKKQNTKDNILKSTTIKS